MSRAGLGLQVLVLVSLCGIIEHELGPVSGASVAPTVPEALSRGAEAGLVEGFSLPPLGRFAQIVERPLFVSTRRPAPPPSPAPLELSVAIDPTPQLAPDVGPFILSAIVIVEDERAALVTDPANGQLTRRREGDLLGAWALDEIRPDSVLLRFGEETKEVPLRRFDDLERGGRKAGTRRGRIDNMANLLQQHIQQKTEKIKRLQAQISGLQNAPSSPDAAAPQEENCGLSRC